MKEDAGSSRIRRISLLEGALTHVGTAVCVCDRHWRLEFANEPFAGLWGLDATSLIPGTPLTTLLARTDRPERVSPQVAEDYLAWCRTLHAEAGQQTREIRFEDGRTYRARHRPLADEDWLITLDDHTAETINAELVSERLSLQSLIDTVPDYLWVKDTDSRFVIANKALAADWGRRPVDLVGLSDHDFHPPEMAGGFRRSERAIIDTDQPMFDRHEFVRDSQGDEKWFSSTKMPLKDLSGTIVGIVGISRDITELKREVSFREGQATVLELIATATPLEDILRSIAVLIEAQISDASASVVLANPERTYIGRNDDPSARDALERILQGILENGPTPEGNWSTGITSQDRVLGALVVHPSTSRMPRPHETAVIEIASRLAAIALERRMSEERIRHMANSDALTGLANRSMLGDLLAQAIDTANRQGGGFHVLFIDLDNFKTVNDTLGHHVGDELLKEVAARLTRCVRACDSVIRLGGDEFVVTLAVESADAIGDMGAVKRIVASVAQPFLFAGHRMDVSCSVGVARFPPDGETPETLLTKADLAMYASKQNGKGRFTVYEDKVR